MTTNQKPETTLDPDNLPTFITVKQFSDFFQISQPGVHRLIKDGELRTIQLSPKGKHRIPRAEITRILNGNV